MRLDSPFVLALAGTIAVHLILITGADAIVVTYPREILVPAPHIELVEVEVPPVVKPPPPPVKQPDPIPDKAPPPPAATQPRVAHTVARTHVEPDPTPPAPHDVPVTGGEQVVHMDDVAPAATGVGVAVGKPTGRVGRGGSGGGTGGGSGAGSGDEVKPVSVATIKTRAMPKGDYTYFDAGKDYPTEARTLGVEGVIRVRLIVDETGKVKSAVLLNKLGHGLDELAMRRAQAIEFDPAKDTDDHPVTSVVVWTFNMTLPK